MLRGKTRGEKIPGDITAGKVICMAAGILFVIMIIACAIAGAAGRLTYTQEIGTGKVDISVKELPAAAWGGSGRYTGNLTAGEVLDYSAVIVNNRADSYVRANVEIRSGTEILSSDGNGYIQGLGPDWIRAGEYYYCTKSLGKGEQMRIFESIRIPEHMTDGTMEKFTVYVIAEAIQSRNFIPDFSSSLPWGAVMLEAAESDGNIYIAETAGDTSGIRFDGEGRFQCDTADLMDHFKEAMPGDRYAKTFAVKNSSGALMDLFLDVKGASGALAEQLRVTIMYKDSTVFRGTAAEAASKSPLEIGLLEEDSEKDLVIMTELPPGMDNGYTDKKDSIIWELAAVNTDGDGPQTGDGSDLVPFAAAALLALSVMMCLAADKRKGRK